MRKKSERRKGNALLLNPARLDVFDELSGSASITNQVREDLRPPSSLVEALLTLRSLAVTVRIRKNVSLRVLDIAPRTSTLARVETHDELLEETVRDLRRLARR
jgi:hypothetical protein